MILFSLNLKLGLSLIQQIDQIMRNPGENQQQICTFKLQMHVLPTKQFELDKTYLYDYQLFTSGIWLLIKVKTFDVQNHPAGK